MRRLPELFDHMLAVNVRAPIFMLQDSAKAMCREGIAGTAVNIISMSSYAGQSFLSPYSVSKGALVTLTRNSIVDFDQSVIGAYDAPPQPIDRLRWIHWIRWIRWSAPTPRHGYRPGLIIPVFHPQ